MLDKHLSENELLTKLCDIVQCSMYKYMDKHKYLKNNQYKCSYMAQTAIDFTFKTYIQIIQANQW